MPGGRGGGGGGARTFHFSTGGGGGGGEGFHFTNPESIFTEFLRSQGGGMGGGRDDGMDDIFPPFGGGGRGGGMGGGMPRSGGRSKFAGAGPQMRQPEPEPVVVEKPLPISLEDLFKGTHKKMKFQQKGFDASGKRTTRERILELDIRPGLKKGSRIKFSNVGEEEGGARQDLVFVVEEVSHKPPFLLPIYPET